MTSADREALLDAIRDEPHDDRLRLVYADWLDDHGQADRAEHVRLCCEIAALPAGDDRAAPLAARRDKLFRRHKKEWGPRLPAAVSASLASRGLVQEVETTAAKFLQCADRLRGEPLSRVKLTDVLPTHVEKLARGDALVGVRELVLFGIVYDEQTMQLLANSRHLGQLRTLRLIAYGVGPSEMRVLAQAPWLANLRTLDLGHYDRDESAPGNAARRNQGIFRAMSGGGTNHLGDDGFIALLDSPHLRNLETLIVANNWIRLDSMRLLWTENRLPSLRRLDVSFNYLGPDGLRELAASDLMKRLTMLEIHANEVGPEAVVTLAASPHVAQLRSLDVSGTTAYDDRPKLTSAAAVAIAESPHFVNLEHLVLTQCAITTSGAQALARTHHLPALRTLHLANNPLRNRGAKAFASSPLLGRLELLDLSGCGVASSAATAFARSKLAGDQLRLDLADNEMDGPAWEALRQRFGGRVTLDEELPAPYEETSDEIPF